MNDELPFKASERSLDERFQSRPQVYARLQRIADLMDQALAQGATADKAEELAIEQLQKLGQDLMGDWAQAQHRQCLQLARAEHPQAVQHAKKK